MRRTILLIFLVACCLGQTFAQLTMGGSPKSIAHPDLVPADEIPLLIVDKPDVEALLLDDLERDANGENLRDAVALPVDVDLENSGAWFDMPDGGKLWRMNLQSPEAVSLELYFDEFTLPVGATFFVYDDDASQVKGAYTSRNNKPTGRFGIDMVIGEVLQLEYYEPASVIGQGQISVQDIAYRYRDVIGIESEEQLGGGSDPCQVDVLCPESEGWQDQIDATVRIRTRINGSFFWCTGTLMNNTAEDCKPYILTALHCALDGADMSTEDELDLYRFYFRYQAPTCGIGNGFAGNSITGCIRRADSNDGGGNSGSDFLLLEMTETPPEEFDPFYAGWNVSSSTTSGGGICVHHPSGDVKKISTFSSTPSSTSWGTFGTHWLVFWEETQSGHGVTEGGSSGSAIFDSNGRVFGTLTGGASFCDAPNAPDRYGKMNRHWTSNPNPPEEKLREWLDPLGLGLTVFDGSADPCDGVSSVTEFQELFIEVFPNPAESQVSIRLAEAQESLGIQLIDLQGRVVADEFIPFLDSNAPLGVDISNINQGTYLLRLSKDQVSLGSTLVHIH